MLVLIQGEALISRAGGALRRKAGDLIGEMGLIEGAPRSADVSAATGVSAIFWKQNESSRCFVQSRHSRSKFSGL